MKKHFEEAEMEIISVDADIITTSAEDSSSVGVISQGSNEMEPDWLP